MYNQVDMFDLPVPQKVSRPWYYYAGILVGIGLIFASVFYLSSSILDNQSLNNRDEEVNNSLSNQTSIKVYEGKVVYVNPQSYPDDEISYVLMDKSNKVLGLLKSSDQKLLLVEGMYVKVSGSSSKSSNGKELLIMVDKVELSGAN